MIGKSNFNINYIEDKDWKVKHIYITPKNEKVKECLIWMHGLGDEPQSFVDWFSEQNCSPFPLTTKVILMHAPYQYVTCNHRTMRSWFDFLDFKKVANDFENAVSTQQIQDVGKKITQIMDQEIELLGDSTKMYIAGLSQGCAMAFYCGLQYPLQLGGLFCFSGFIPQNTIEHAANKKTPIYISHGQKDQLIPWEQSQIQYELRFDPKQRRVIYDLLPEMPHTMVEEQLLNWKKEFQIINNKKY